MTETCRPGGAPVSLHARKVPDEKGKFVLSQITPTPRDYHAANTAPYMLSSQKIRDLSFCEFSGAIRDSSQEQSLITLPMFQL